MRVIFMGSPEFSVPSLEHLILSQHEVVAVYTQPDKPAGRGRSLVAPPVKLAAADRGVPVFQPARLREAGAVAELAELRPDIIVVAAYGQILPQSVLDIPPRGCINVHPSLLPRFRGASPVVSAILSGDTFAGVSIMLLDAGMDTGPVLARSAIAIAPRDTAGSLAAKLSLVAAGFLEDVLVRWSHGEITPRPQNEDEATYTRQFAKEDGEIDWNLPAVDIWRRVRAFNPWPGCYTTWHGRQLKILEAAPVVEEDRSGVGRVVALQHEVTPLGVRVGSGTLGVITVQLEGKRAMSADEFLRGQRDFIGEVLPG